MMMMRKRKENTMPFGVNLMKSQVLYRAAQDDEDDDDAFGRQQI